jgi:hypothetical protein
VASEDRINIYKALAQRTGFEVVNERVSDKKLRFTGRLPKNKANFFVLVVKQLLLAEMNAEWSTDISRWYVLDERGMVRYAWRFIVQGPAPVDQYFNEVARAIASSPRPSRVELDEVPLPGYAPGVERGGQSATGKGAAPMFKATTGIAAKNRLMSGGH